MKKKMIRLSEKELPNFSLKKEHETKHPLKVRGNYKVVTDWMRKTQIYTKQDVIDFYINHLGKDYKAACGSAIIMLSPRLESKHGDSRGSASNPWGHLAYNEKLPRRKDPETGVKEKQRYRFRYRETPLEKKHHTYYQRRIVQEKVKHTSTVPIVERVLDKGTVEMV